MQIALALVITLVSACLLNVGYLLEHSVASNAPPLSLRHPVTSLRSLLGNRRWLLGFGSEATGWLLYVAALALAPLSLVQATAAGGIGILAVMVSRVTHVPLTGRERVGALLSVVGLALLGVSLLGSHSEGSVSGYLWISVWLAASAGAAVILIQLANLMLLNKLKSRDRVAHGKKAVIHDASMDDKYTTAEPAEGATGEHAFDLTDRKNDEFVYLY